MCQRLRKSVSCRACGETGADVGPLHTGGSFGPYTRRSSPMPRYTPTLCAIAMDIPGKSTRRIRDGNKGGTFLLTFCFKADVISLVNVSRYNELKATLR